jgi:cytochrome c553
MVKAALHVPFLVGLASVALFLGHVKAWASDEADHAARLALPLPANTDEGKSLYKANCFRCHGSNGFGDGDLGIPTLAGQRFRYLVLQLADFSDDRRDSTAMHRVMAHASLQRPQAWVDVATYLTELPLPRETQIGTGARTAQGRRIFREQCVACHGQDARGDDQDFIPSLRNQHYSYLVNQIVRIAEGHRHNVDKELVRFLQGFGGPDIDGVADYLSRLRGSGNPGPHSRQ